MQQHPIGTTTALVTALGFGGASAGNLYTETTDGEAAAAVDRAWAGGIRYFDTAPHYGLGLSERRIGSALRDRPREVFVVSTKVGRLLEPNPRPGGSDLAAGGFAVPDTLRRRFGFSPAAVRRSLEGSLERLGLDRVDLVYVHDPDEHVDEALTGAIPELIRMRDEGLVRAVGVGMNQWQAPLPMVRETGIDLVMLAGRWTLLDRSGEPCSTSAPRGGWRWWRPPRSTPGCWPGPGPPTGRTSTTGRPPRGCWPGRGPWPGSAHGTGCRCRTRPSSSRCAIRPWYPWSAGCAAQSR